MCYGRSAAKAPLRQHDWRVSGCVSFTRWEGAAELPIAIGRCDLSASINAKRPIFPRFEGPGGRRWVLTDTRARAWRRVMAGYIQPQLIVGLYCFQRHRRQYAIHIVHDVADDLRVMRRTAVTFPEIRAQVV